jgi:hypothetical protein
MLATVRTFVLQHREGTAVLASSGLFLSAVYILTTVLL